MSNPSKSSMKPATLNNKPKGTPQPQEREVQPAAIILADRLVTGELKDIFGNLESASLSIAGKTIVEHTLLELQELNFEQCIVLAGNNAEDILTMVSNNRWGMSVNVMAYSSSTEQILREFKSISEPHGMLVIEADKLRSSCIGDFLSVAAKSEHTLLEAHNMNGSTGITLLKHERGGYLGHAMPIVLDDLILNSLEYARDFHEANFDVVSGVYTGLEPSVMMSQRFQRRQHWSSHVSESVISDWSEVMVEKHCQVGHNVSLHAAILNQGVYVEGQAELDQTIVMPESIVSAGCSLTDSIVHQGAVFQLS